MPALSDDEYESLKTSIKKDGVQVPIILDSERTNIDGHHRINISNELGLEEIPALEKEFDSDFDKIKQAYALNSSRRQNTLQAKKEIIESYFLDLDEYGVHETDQEIADALGVDRTWVTKVRQKLVSGKKVTTHDFTTQEIKHEIVARSRRGGCQLSLSAMAKDWGKEVFVFSY